MKYIARELDSALDKKYTYSYVIGIAVLCVVANIAVVAFRTIYGTNEGTYAYNIIEYATWSFIIPYLTCILIADMVFGKDYPNPHIKDGISSELSRAQIYIGKLVAAIMLAIIFLVITFVVLIATTTLFQFRDGAISASTIRGFCEKMLVAIPLFVAGISFGNMFLFVFENKKKAFVGFYILTLLIPRVIMFLAMEPISIGLFKSIRKYTISQSFTLIPFPSNPERSVLLIISLGVIYTIVSTTIGIVIYNKKNITDN